MNKKISIENIEFKFDVTQKKINEINHDEKTNKISIYDYEHTKYAIPGLQFYIKNITELDIIKRIMHMTNNNEDNITSEFNKYNYSEFINSNSKSYKYYHLDNNNKMFIKGKNIVNIMKKLEKKYDFVENIINLMKKSKYVFQEYDLYNEINYHKISVSCECKFTQIYGFIKME